MDAGALGTMMRRMARTEEALLDLGADLQRLMARLSVDWHGSASEARQLAHAEWERGMSTMHSALHDLRRAADVAHGNYTKAAEANERMWAQTR